MSTTTGLTAIAAIAFAVAVTLAPATANADPAPPPGPANPWMVDCHGQQVPVDPRVSLQNPLGGLIYWHMLQAVCAPEGEAPSP